jgi:hypothetical protein
MCDDRERLIAYVYGECDAGERGAMERHLAECFACRGEINALRRVRQDLLAWDVPEPQPIWRPVLRAQPAHWATRASGWMLAAAASLVLMAGAAGGAVTSAYLTRGTPAAVAAATSGPNRVMRGQAARTVVSQADLDALEHRIVTQVRAELDDRVKLVAAHATSAPAATPADLEARRQIRDLRQALSDFSTLAAQDISTLYRYRQQNTRASDYVQVSFPGPAGR